MQNAQQYREFAETLANAAQSANPATRDILMAAADTWRTLADALESPAPAEVVDFAEAAGRLRRTA